MYLKSIVASLLGICLFFNCNQADNTKTLADVSVTHIEAEAIQPKTIETVVKEENDNFYFTLKNNYKPFKKNLLDKAFTYRSYLSPEEAANAKNLKSFQFDKLLNDRPILNTVSNTSETLNEAQIEFLRGLNYGDDFIITVNYQLKNDRTKALENYDMDRRFTVVPEVEAHFKAGNEIFVNQLKALTQNEFKSLEKGFNLSGRLFFTVTKTGKITDVIIHYPSKLSKVDNMVIDALKKSSGLWQAAKDINGNPVNQKLGLDFANFIGC